MNSNKLRPPKTAGSPKTRHAVDRPASSLCTYFCVPKTRPHKPRMVANARSARAQSKHSRPCGPAPRDYPTDERHWVQRRRHPSINHTRRAAETKRALRQQKLTFEHHEARARPAARAVRPRPTAEEHARPRLRPTGHAQPPTRDRRHERLLHRHRMRRGPRPAHHARPPRGRRARRTSCPSRP